MSDFFENLNFSSDSFHVLLVIYLFFLKNFHGNFLACEDVRALLDLAKSTLSQSLACS